MIVALLELNTRLECNYVAGDVVEGGFLLVNRFNVELSYKSNAGLAAVREIFQSLEIRQVWKSCFDSLSLYKGMLQV